MLSNLFFGSWLDALCLLDSNSDEILEKLGKVLAESKVAKALIGWNLEELETAALESLERESDSDDMSSEDFDDSAHAPLWFAKKKCNTKTWITDIFLQANFLKLGEVEQTLAIPSALSG